MKRVSVAVLLLVLLGAASCGDDEPAPLVLLDGGWTVYLKGDRMTSQPAGCADDAPDGVEWRIDIDFHARDSRFTYRWRAVPPNEAVGGELVGRVFQRPQAGGTSLAWVLRAGTEPGEGLWETDPAVHRFQNGLWFVPVLDPASGRLGTSTWLMSGDPSVTP